MSWQDAFASIVLGIDSTEGDDATSAAVLWAAYRVLAAEEQCDRFDQDCRDLIAKTGRCKPKMPTF